MSTVPDWSEKQPTPPELLPYEAAADEIAELDDPVEQREEVAAFLEDILDRADSGLIKTVRKNADGSVEVKSYDRSMLLDQFKSFQEAANKPDGSDIFDRIPSAVKIRRAFRRLGEDPLAAPALMDGLSDLLLKQEALLQAENMANLSEAERLQAAQHVGKEAVQQTTSAEQDPLDRLDPGPREEIIALRRAEANKADAERRQSYGEVADDKRLIGRLKAELSKQARDFLENKQ